MKFNLLVTDIDNTVFDWVGYYATSLHAMLGHVGGIIGVPLPVLLAEAKTIFTQEASIEYPFVVQRLPSVEKFYGDDIDKMIHEAVEPAREVFKTEAGKWLKPYAGVIETITEIKKLSPQTVLVALTDAPRYVAMWKLNKLGLLHLYDAVYGLADPKLPTDTRLGRVKVNPKILLKHLQQSNFDFKGKIRILPDEYEKPGVRGLKTVLMDYDLDENPEKRAHVLWVGDNLRKDMGLGHKVGVTTAWAKFGTHLDQGILAQLRAFSPPTNIEKNVPLHAGDPQAPSPDFTLHEFADLRKCFTH